MRRGALWASSARKTRSWFGMWRNHSSRISRNKDCHLLCGSLVHRAVQDLQRFRLRPRCPARLFLGPLAAEQSPAVLLQRPLQDHDFAVVSQGGMMKPGGQLFNSLGVLKRSYLARAASDI